MDPVIVAACNAGIQARTPAATNVLKSERILCCKVFLLLQGKSAPGRQYYLPSRLLYNDLLGTLGGHDVFPKKLLQNFELVCGVQQICRHNQRRIGERMSVRWRRVRGTEVLQCLSIAPKEMGAGLVGKEKALQIWRELADHPSFFAAAVEADPPFGPHRLVAFGAACFVRPQFTDENTRTPRPGVNDRFIASCASPNPGVLRGDELARHNAGAGVDVLQLYGNVVETLPEPQLLEAQMALGAAFYGLVRGYRLRTVFTEIFADLGKRYARTLGSTIVEFPETDSILSYGSREIAQSNPGSAAALLLQYSEPVLRLRETDQELLLAALDGATDEELGPVLGLSFSTVKARWRSLLARIEHAKPEWSAPDGNGAARGPQRRHRVLAYCREHPEELRPYDWTVTVKAR